MKNRYKRKSKTCLHQADNCQQYQRSKPINTRNVHIRENLDKVNPDSTKERKLVDCPFYHYKFGFDTLPLDPAKAFIIEKKCMCIHIYICTPGVCTPYIIYVLFDFFAAHLQNKAKLGYYNNELNFITRDVDVLEKNVDCETGDAIISLENIRLPTRLSTAGLPSSRNYNFDGKYSTTPILL